jgi:phosphoglucomutase
MNTLLVFWIQLQKTKTEGYKSEKQKHQRSKQGSWAVKKRGVIVAILEHNLYNKNVCIIFLKKK